MLLGQLLVLHLMAGVGVAGAVYLTERRRVAVRWIAVVMALLFWPLYLPVLLSREAGQPRNMRQVPAPVADDLGRAIAQVDAELEQALRSLDGWAEDVLAREKDRLGELRGAWISQAQRIRDMDRLLDRADCAEPLVLPDEIELDDRVVASQQVIRANVERLRQVRQRALAELLGQLAWVRELASMIHLAKFTGAPPSRAEELVAQIAAAVEGLSALTWEEASISRLP